MISPEPLTLHLPSAITTTVTALAACIFSNNNNNPN
jgi:hypothetical protein